MIEDGIFTTRPVLLSCELLIAKIVGFKNLCVVFSCRYRLVNKMLGVNHRLKAEINVNY